MKKIWIYTLPLIIVVPLAFIILRPGPFNFIPFAIHEACSMGSNEAMFIIGFDLVVLFLIYLFLYFVIKKMANNKR